MPSSLRVKTAERAPRLDLNPAATRADAPLCSAVFTPSDEGNFLRADPLLRVRYFGISELVGESANYKQSNVPANSETPKYLTVCYRGVVDYCRIGITGASTRDELRLLTCNVFLAVTEFVGKSIVSGSPVLGLGS